MSQVKCATNPRKWLCFASKCGGVRERYKQAGPLRLWDEEKSRNRRCNTGYLGMYMYRCQYVCVLSAALYWFQDFTPDLWSDSYFWAKKIPICTQDKKSLYRIHLFNVACVNYRAEDLVTLLAVKARLKKGVKMLSCFYKASYDIPSSSYTCNLKALTALM